MLKNLRTLMKLRTWWKSKTLTVSGVLAALMAIDLAAPSDIVLTIVTTIANAGGVSVATVLALLGVVRELVAVVMRAKTERSLERRADE